MTLTLLRSDQVGRRLVVVVTKSRLSLSCACGEIWIFAEFGRFRFVLKAKFDLTWFGRLSRLSTEICDWLEWLVLFVGWGVYVLAMRMYALITVWVMLRYFLSLPNFKPSVEMLKMRNFLRFLCDVLKEDLFMKIL